MKGFDWFLRRRRRPFRESFGAVTLGRDVIAVDTLSSALRKWNSSVKTANYFVCSATVLGTLQCNQTHGQPPGADRDAVNPIVVVASGAPTQEQSGLVPTSNVAEPGSTGDNLPFVPTGERAASTAFRTWVYTDVGRNRTRFGYLRLGATFDIRGPVIKNDGCDEGWVRVNPRGFVCLGKGASIDLNSPIVVQANVRPKRGDGHPYIYALAGDDPPHFYFQLPSKEQIRRIEGRDPYSRFEQWRLLKVKNVPAVAALLGTPEEPPEFLQNGGRLIKPYGVLHRLEEKVHSGRAAADSGFAISRVMVHEQRWYGMTTEHDIVALDRTRISVPSSLRGLPFPKDGDLPAGIVENEQLAQFTYDPAKRLVAAGALSRRQVVLLTGKTLPGGMMETRDGHWLAAEGMRVIHARKEFPSFATGDRKWIDLSIYHQTLVAYEGRKAVFATLVSTGRGGMGDPETESATPRGTFMIYAKHVSATMDGEDDAADSYSLLDVPFVQYFHKGFALHGTYWHDDFGKVRSHGCVNLAAYDAAWLFEWTDPQVSADWHGVINKERGTVVYIHG